MEPVEETRRERLCGEMKALFERLPRLGKEAEALEKDLEEIRMHQPLFPMSGAPK